MIPFAVQKKKRALKSAEKFVHLVWRGISARAIHATLRKTSLLLIAVRASRLFAKMENGVFRIFPVQVLQKNAAISVPCALNATERIVHNPIFRAIIAIRIPISRQETAKQESFTFAKMIFGNRSSMKNAATSKICARRVILW